MPNNDLGTAHGRIRVDYDSKGSVAATAALIKMQRQFEQMNNKLGKIEKSLRDTDNGLGSVEREMRKATKATDGFSGSLLSGNKSLFKFARETQDLADDLKTMYSVMHKGKKHFDRFSKGLSIMSSAGGVRRGDHAGVFRALSISIARMGREHDGVIKTMMDGQEKIVGSFSKSSHALLGLRSGVSILSASFWALRNKIFGVNAAMDQSPNWVKNLRNVATSFGLAGVAASTLAVAVKPLRKLKVLADSGIFKKLVQDTHNLSDSLKRFSDVSRRVFGRDIFSGFRARLRMTQVSLFKFLDGSAKRSISLHGSLRLMSGFFKGLSRDSLQLVGGIALLTNSMKNLWQRFQWFFKLPKPIMAGLAIMISRVLPSALQSLGKALSGTSNLLVGLWDGLKQIGRGFVVLPGMISVVVASLTSLIPIFSGLKKSFNDIFSNDRKRAWEAWYKLPTHLRPMALALKKVVPLWKELQKNVQKVAFKGIEKQIESLSKGYFPIFERGAKKVALSMREMKDEFVSFLLLPSSGKDTSTIYAETADAIRHMAGSTKPAISGLQDMSVEGSKFISQMMSFGPSLSKQFENWAKLNRENGNMMRWMEESSHGIYNLIKGVKELSGSLWSVLTLFKTNSGANFLQRFADAMVALNKRAKESAITGLLAKIREGAKNMGADKIKQLKDLFKIFTGTLERAIPFVKGVSDAFSGKFIFAMKTSLFVTSKFLELVNEFGATKLIGWILGTAAAFVLLPKVVGTATDAIKGITGVIGILLSKDKVIDAMRNGFSALAAVLEGMGGGWAKLGNSLLNISGTADGVISVIGKFVKGLAIAGTALSVFYSIYSSNKQEHGAFSKQLADNERGVLKFGEALRKSFMSSGGIIDSGVLSEITTGVDTMMQNLEATASKGPGFGSQLWDFTTRMFNQEEYEVNKGIRFSFDQSKRMNDWQEEVNQAKLAAAGLKNLREEGVDLTAVMAMSDSDFKAFIDHQRTLGHEANAAADALEGHKQKIIDIRKDYERAGPKALLLAEGVSEIADAGGDATSKLSGLKKVLEALGWLKTDKLDALAAFYSSLREIKEELQDIVDLAEGGIKDIVINGEFNVTTEAGSQFYEKIKNIGSDYLAAVSLDGADINKLFETAQQQLIDVGKQLELDPEIMKNLGNDVGIFSDTGSLKLLLQATPETKDLVISYLQMQQQLKNGIKAPVEVVVPSGNTEELVKKITDAIGDGKVSRNGNNLVINPTLNEADLQKILQILVDSGIEIPGFTKTPTEPATLPIKPEASPDTPAPATGGLPQQVTPGGGSGQSPFIIPNLTGGGGRGESFTSLAIPEDRDAKDAGSKFVDALADGIEGNDSAERAASALGASILRKFHQSPPQEGPLSAHGDAAKYAGAQFGQSYATGITNQEGAVRGASGRLAGSAAGGVTGGNLQTDRNYQAGKFLGEIMSIVDFAENMVNAMTKLGEVVIGAAGFLSDPMGKGTFFGKRNGFKRDPNFDARARGDATQQRAFDFHGSGRRPDVNPRSVGLLAPGSSRQDTANYIIDKALSLGYSKEQADMFLIQAVGESNGLDPLANGGNQNGTGDVRGIFQFTPDTWRDYGSGDPLNPQNNIDSYFQLAAERGLTPENFVGGTQLGFDVSIGGPWHTVKNPGHLATARENAQKFIQGYTPGGGQMVPGIPFGMPAAPGNLPMPSILKDSGEVPSGPQSKAAAFLVQQMFPQITEIGGSYLPQSKGGPSVPGTHDAGLSIDVRIPNWDTPQGKALGKQIESYLQSQAGPLGIEYTVFDNLITNTGGSPQPFGGSGPNDGHYNHIDIKFNGTGATAVGPDGTMNFNVPYGSPGAGGSYAAPPTPEELAEDAKAPKELVIRNPDTSPGAPPFIPIHGDEAGNAPGAEFGFNEATGQPWTKEDVQASADYWNQPGREMRFDNSLQRPGDATAPGVFQGTQKDLTEAWRANNPDLARDMADAMDYNKSDDDVIPILDRLNMESQRQLDMDTPTSRAMSSQIDSVISGASGDRGLIEGDSPVDMASNIASAASSVAGSVFKVINSVIDSVGATKNIADTMVRGVQNSEDLFNMVDEIQTYIQLVADVAGATADITSVIGGIVGAAGSGDPSMGSQGAAMAIQAVGQIAGIVQMAYETVNAYIDLAQEAYRILGSYYGQFLGMLVGGPAGPLMGNVKFLLDEEIGHLLAYSQDNPLDKRAHDLSSFKPSDPNARNQMVGNINVYGGPGRDPRDDTRQMMFQVKASSMAQATGQ